MSQRSKKLRALVTERLAAAVEDIFVLVERTIAEYEQELSRSEEENQRKQQLLDTALCPQLLLHRTGLKQENCNDAQITEAPRVQVKKEDLMELPISVPQEDTHWEDTSTVDIWTVPLKEDTRADAGALEMATEDINMEQGESVEAQIVVRKRNRTKTCPVCNKKFTRGCDLKRHERIHVGVKPYSCSVCNRRFFGERYVEVHMRTHTGELPFQCPQCEKRFGTKSSLNLHLKTIHSQMRPFSCSVCARTFKTKGHLKEHLLRHTEFRPLRCRVCGKGYWRRRELDVHVAKHATDEDRSPAAGSSN